MWCQELLVLFPCYGNETENIFYTFVSLSITEELDKGCKIGIQRHNEEVTKNQHILSRIIDRLAFCKAFELALCANESSNRPRIVCGLVDFVAFLDRLLK